MSEPVTSLVFISPLINPDDRNFPVVFPHLVPGVLRRKLTHAQIRQRALSETLALARSARRSMQDTDPTLIEEMAIRFVDRVFNGSVLEKFDPAKGPIDNYLRGVMRKIGLECRARRARLRFYNGYEQPEISSDLDDPQNSVERKDMVEHIKQWATEMPAPQRNAVARKYEALADLDTGGFIPNEAVNRHRGLKYLRKRASISEARMTILRLH